MDISDIWTNETRKRYLFAGIILGTAAVGLTLLARRTPRDQWGETLGRIAKDALTLAKGRYGDSAPVALVEKTLERLQEDGAGETSVSRAFSEALQSQPHKA